MPQQGPPKEEILLPDHENEKGLLDSIFEYLPLNFWEKHAEQTNLYSVQNRNHRSVNTTTDELIHLAGIHLMMGCLGYPQCKMYWQYDTAVPAITNCMTRDRFFELRSNVHFVDNEGGHEDTDRLWKVRPLIDCVRQKCLTLPRPNHISLDEQMVPFSVNCLIRQYVPTKPNPLGLKCFVLAAPDGLVLDLHFYTGKGTVSDADMKELGLGASVVKLLCESVPQNNNHCIYTDRFFTSIKSLEYLLKRNTYQTGTVMKNRIGRVIDKLKTDKQLKRGEWDEKVREDDKVCVIKWKDNKSVLLLSSCVGSEPVTTCKRWSKEEKKKVTIPQPMVVNLYNDKMGGVDLCDRFMSFYRCYIRTRKWPVRLYNHFVDLVVVNCWVMYHRWCVAQGVPSKMRKSLLQYKIYMAKAMMNYQKVELPICAPRKRGRPRTSNGSDEVDGEGVDDPENNLQAKKPRKVVCQPIAEIRYDDVGHMPKFVDAKNASKCRNEGCKSKTRVMCIKCGLYLCILSNNCFIKYHTK